MHWSVGRSNRRGRGCPVTDSWPSAHHSSRDEDSFILVYRCKPSQGASGGANGQPLPTPDVTGGINMSATAGKVALVNSNANLTDLDAYDIIPIARVDQIRKVSASDYG